MRFTDDNPRDLVMLGLILGIPSFLYTVGVIGYLLHPHC